MEDPQRTTTARVHPTGDGSVSFVLPFLDVGLAQNIMFTAAAIAVFHRLTAARA
ncbi:hypothetical protein BH23ACT10_BH23ACT10_25520 [soil metagenome]